MAYLTSFFFCLIIAMQSSMAQVTNWDANAVVYPESGLDQFQRQSFNQQQQFGPPTRSPRLTSQSREVVICAQTCLTTNENNPVCGTDNFVHYNERRLDCTNMCGRRLDPNWQEIGILRRGACTPGSRVNK